MKIYTFFAISWTFILGNVYAEGPFYTTLSSDGKNIFAGVKLEKKDYEPETYIQQISGDKLISKKIPLPKELFHRDVIGIFTAEQNRLVILTQRTAERGDHPLFYTLDSDKNEWKKVGELNCISFAKITVEKNSMTLHCVDTNDEGKRVETPKRINLEGIIFTQVGEITLPVTNITKNSLRAGLLGDPFEWNEIKVGKDKKEKVFSP
jgi:hypothetical protein